MNTKHFVSRLGIIALVIVLLLGFPSASALGRTLPEVAPAGTAFTYQGQLARGGQAFSGSCGFQFGLWDALTGGSQVGSTATLNNVPVTNGLFMVRLDFGASAFTGSARWLEIAVMCPGDPGYTTLAPRQELTPAPYALYAASAGNAASVTNGVYTTGSYANPAWITSLAGSKISGAVASATNATTVTNGVYTTGSYANPGWITSLAGTKISGAVASATSAANFSGSLSGDVTGTQSATSVTKLRGVTVSSTAPANGQFLQYNGSQWAPASLLASFWSLTGNSATNPATNFLGTIDNQPLVFKVNNARALRLEPNATSPNIIGGYSGNSVTAGVVGAVISGGGYASYLNLVTDDYGVVGGGAKNQAGDNTGATTDQPYATIGGGYNNYANSNSATVGGGHGNNSSGAYSTIGGGNLNNTNAPDSTVAGGYGNNAYGFGVFIGGGGYDGTTHSGNTAIAKAATIGGGLGNQIPIGSDYTFIGGGEGNTASGAASTISGGDRNTTSNNLSTVSGGYSNTASGSKSTIGGGDTNAAGGLNATIGGGYSNTANSTNSTIAGGTGNYANGLSATVGGGAGNSANGDWTSIPGGYLAAATHYGEVAYASGDIASAGDAQASEYVLRNTTTDATQTELFLDGSGQRLTLASGRTLSFDILIVAHSDGGDSAGYEFKGLIENVGGATNFVGGIPTATILGEDVPAWDVVVRANDTYDALLIKVTGVAGTNIRWVASVRTVEVGW